jgi:tRNA(Ile)-lysidine synthase
VLRRHPDAVIDELLARCSFPPRTTPVSCAFSGGADSTALVVLAAAAGCQVTAIHVDHGLRPESGAEAEQARHVAAAVGVGFRLERLELADGPNLEARARAARLSALAPDPTRPLIALRRGETRALCAHVGLVPVDDPMNDDARFVRTRVRHELLPLMDSIARRDVVPLLVRAAEVAADDLALADAAASELDPTDARALRAAAPALARRALRRWLADDGYPPDAATVARVLAVARGEHRACEIAGGRRVERHAQRLRIVTVGLLVSNDGMSSTAARREPGPD